jgi:hypothetical protein
MDNTHIFHPLAGTENSGSQSIRQKIAIGTAVLGTPAHQLGTIRIKPLKTQSSDRSKNLLNNLNMAAAGKRDPKQRNN